MNVQSEKKDIVTIDRQSSRDVLKRIEAIHYRLDAVLKVIDGSTSLNNCGCYLEMIGPRAILEDTRRAAYDLLIDLPENARIVGVVKGDHLTPSPRLYRFNRFLGGPSSAADRRNSRTHRKIL